MSTEHQLRVQFFSIFFIVALIYQDTEGVSFKAGKFNVTTTLSLFACKNVSFEEPFNGGQEIKIFISKSHATKSSTRGNGAAIWVESVNNKAFTVCILEYGDGSSGTSQVNWMALQSVPTDAQLGTASLNSWTTGTKCKRIAFEKLFLALPNIIVTARHQVLKRPQDGLAVWVEDSRKDSFKLCARETKIFDGIHKNIKVDWMAFIKLKTDNFTLTNSLVFTNNNSPSNKKDNNAVCQKVNFQDVFYAPPVVLVSPRLGYNNNKSRFSGSEQCNAVTAWVENTSTNETEVCVRSYNNDANYKGIIKVDYMVIGDLDPCIDVTCHYHSLCKAFGPNDARCVCLDSCPTYKEPVCSSNGTTYDNKCLFEQEVCLNRLNFTVQHPGSCEGFPLQRGRLHMAHIPSLGYSHCQVIRFEPFVFYPDKSIEVQITVNHMDTTDKSYVHDAAVSWIENVNNGGFTACVMAAGYNERTSYANVTVDWMAYQGAPMGGVTGELRMSQWWTGTTCATVKFPTGKFSVKPSVFVTSKHYNPGLKRDAASVWIEDVTKSSCKVCMRELQNYAGSHRDIFVNWLAFSDLPNPPFSEHNSIYFANDKPPNSRHYNVFCKEAIFAKSYNTTPHVFVSASHSTKGGNQSPVHNSIAAWVEYISRKGFRVCVKELYEAKYDPLFISYIVLSDICPDGWDYFNGYCYLTSTVCAPWVTAVSNCSAMNSHLVTVHNQEENVYIQHRHNGERSWIGLNDRSVEGSFVWTNKEIIRFHYWAPQQPNNLKNEDCVHALGAEHGYTWNDVSCDKCYNYTCVKEIDECISNYHRCDPNAACQNTVGSYICTCKAGFYGNGKKCSDIDECSNKTHKCDVNAVCSNTQGSHNCTCTPGYSGDGKKCIAVAKNCAELYKAGKRSSGVYKIDPDGAGAFDVYCDQTTAGGGWTVFQKRVDGSVNFYRGWNDYKKGFGNLNGEFWLGLDKIHRLTKTKNKLRVDLEDFNRNTAYAEYSYFAITDERSKYKLSLGTYSGNAGDSLARHGGYSFSTKDRDNDGTSGSCATSYKGAWWYESCHQSNLNGLYHRGRHSSFADGVNWYHWKGYYYSAKRAEMKLKPVNF
ncbi:unnamed protein product [Porites lobata]|uniref:Uncharacterized protein n=1 Tax=Porites lobata TaxID=104759 RepID=A0ABN8R7I3_9CNID|nr:unnamed protein product [Porites lobata]